MTVMDRTDTRLPTLRSRRRQGYGRKIRDGLYIGAGLLIVAFTVIGVFSATRFAMGLGTSNGDGSHNDGHSAKVIVAAARHRARIELKNAHLQARRILADARATSHKHHNRKGHHRNGGSGTTTDSTPTATPTITATPVATPTIPGAPDLSQFPSSWVIDVFSYDPTTAIARVANTSYDSLSGQVVVTFTGVKGKGSTRRVGTFKDVPDRSVASVTLAASPAQYSSYRITVRNIHSP
jgi:hypothetical protein